MLTVPEFIFAGFVLLLIFTAMANAIIKIYIKITDARPGICMQHEPRRVFDISTKEDFIYFECKKCGERSVKLSWQASLYSSALVETDWLLGQENKGGLDG